MTALPLPDTTGTDGHWCPTCGVHRTTGVNRKCPICEDKAKREEQ